MQNYSTHHYAILNDAPAYRCPRCNKLVFFADGIHGLLHLICPRCRILLAILDGLMITKRPDGETSWSRVIENRRRARRGLQGAFDRTDLTKPDPSKEDIMSLMEQRWNVLWKNKVRQKAELAIGLRFQVFQRDHFCCRYCGSAAADGAILEVDHVNPRSRGGADSLDNLVTACWECNRGKGAGLLTTAPKGFYPTTD